MMRRLFISLLSLPLLLSTVSCTSPYLKGVSSSGEKVYVGPLPIEDSEAFSIYTSGTQRELDKVRYLFKRVTDEKDLKFHRDGRIFSPEQAYKGGMWLIRNRYHKDMSATDFIRNHVWRSEVSGNPHLAEFPDGSIHEGYYVLLNELNLLEEKTKS